ncbi:STAS domain-containing protein [Geodermatophilus sp. CPCC 206100]|uniref:STAS domain-containing protein n=1 Tax=Geodermatophilus sp. CPCC 206100 TaxID=3020054 RepID=UPI003AFF9FA6
MAAAVPPPHPQGTVRRSVEEGRTVLHLSGEIDSAVVAAYESPQGSGGSDPGRSRAVSIVDASAVTFMASVGIGLILRETEATRRDGRRPVLRRPTAPVRRVLSLTGLDGVFDVTD